MEKSRLDTHLRSWLLLSLTTTSADVDMVLDQHETPTTWPPQMFIDGLLGLSLVTQSVGGEACSLNSSVRPHMAGPDILGVRGESKTCWPLI